MFPESDPSKLGQPRTTISARVRPSTVRHRLAPPYKKPPCAPDLARAFPSLPWSASARFNCGMAEPCSGSIGTIAVGTSTVASSKANRSLIKSVDELPLLPSSFRYAQKKL